ncbi:phosphoesterase-domain-containing protein [Microthyrium microscopicum]|uniref:acid phosphatase n=1 Tax=Microthyrium microscopicum TaxID=703497 RepID=A0A6A6UDZ0_9PEZI|nr:phosphoesterase-domain-containing protein [Microthyrium microscopicum]
MKSICVSLLLGASSVVLAASSVAEAPESTLLPSSSAIAAAQATAKAISPVSNVQGKSFQRFYQVWLENTDYSAAAGDPNQIALSKLGITLTNYWAVTHPSEPNYVASVAGDYFGMDNDDFHAIPSNISTVVDLLDTKGISWAEYQEGAPYAGFQGFNYSNQKTFANNYVRKHNPLIIFQSVTSNATRISQIKNFTSLASDVAANTLPQWAFITPNMTNDGHDTNVTFASKWESSAIGALINNTSFMNGTLLLLTFDEDETYTQQNKVFSILIGGPDVIPSSLVGTTDNTFYDHYSTISSVAVNWGLPSLGRWDCNANVFAVVANKTGYTNQNVSTTSLYNNQSYPGPLSDTSYIPVWPVPNTSAKCASGQGVLPAVVKTWGNQTQTYNYTSVVPSASNGTSTSSSPAASSSKAGASTYEVSGALAVLAGFAAMLV